MTDIPDGQRPPILVVEDHEDSRELLTQLLTIWGYSVAAAETGREAFALLDGGLTPRVVILDLMLPEISGWTMLDRLRSSLRLHKIPVIVLTAVAPDVLQREPIVADALLSKPVNYEELEQLVRTFSSEGLG